MISRFFHAWESRLASLSTTERVISPSGRGLDWLHERPSVDRPPLAMVRAWVDEMMRDTDAFFTPPPTRDPEFIAADAATRGEVKPARCGSQCARDTARHEQRRARTALQGRR